MKRIVLLFTSMLVLFATSSCGNSVKKSIEQEKSETILKESLKAPSSYKFVSFELDEEETLKEQIEDRLEYFEGRYIKDEKDNQMIAHLKGLLEDGANDVSAIVAREYILTYEAQNVMGVMLRSTFKTRFNEDGEIVAVKYDDDDWGLLGNFFSIPGYYELL